ncbi:hypothetical protein J6590_083838 [Homalodisca vitripennis]|nr:hypothetical protein J6590_083838 [Homalodisca vitripennis]
MFPPIRFGALYSLTWPVRVSYLRSNQSSIVSAGLLFSLASTSGKADITTADPKPNKLKLRIKTKTELTPLERVEVIMTKVAVLTWQCTEGPLVTGSVVYTRAGLILTLLLIGSAQAK